MRLGEWGEDIPYRAIISLGLVRVIVLGQGRGGGSGGVFGETGGMWRG